MKHQTLKIGILATALALLSISVTAQLPGPSLPTDYVDFITTDETIDSVTVGSRMPYRVAAQSAPSTLPSGFTFEYKWAFSGSLSVLTFTGASATAGTGTDFYEENEISVVMPSSTGDITISTNVQSLFNGSVLCPAGPDETNTIRVIDRPTITWTPAVEAFCAGIEVNIPISFSGIDSVEVRYRVDYYDTYDKSGGRTSTSGALYQTLSGTTLDLAAGAFGSGDGLYEIIAENVTDRISRKSLDQTLVESQSGDLPSGAYQVLIIPAPTTSPLEHVRNMY